MNKTLGYYMALPYRVDIQEDKDEGGFALSYPELPGCITCAATIEEGMHMLHDAKQCWLEACLASGVEIPEPSRA